jgi:low affinity Fe/Cu permease
MENEKDKLNVAKSNAFMNFLNDPSQVINSTKFSIATASTQFFALMFFAIIGASISFRFTSFRDIWDLNYWINVVVLLVEQLYAYNIGYDLGRSLGVNANKELKTTEQQIEYLVEGVYEENGNEVKRGLKKDSSYIEPALDILMDNEKVSLLQTRMKEIIGIFESKFDYFKALPKKWFLFPKKIKVAKHKAKMFWRKKSALFYCHSQIEMGKEMLKDRESILAVPDRNVKGFQRLTYADIMSSQNGQSDYGVSRYFQRDEKTIKAKAFGKKAIVKFGLAAIGSSILFGATGGSQTFGLIIYSLFLLIVHLASGFKFGSNNVITIILHNTANRLQACKDIQKKIPILIKEEQEKLPQEPITPLETDFDILPPLNIS